MANGLMDRFSHAKHDPPEVMYVDRGCCRVNGVSAIENLFNKWAEAGMIVRLDIFHWIHRFDAAVRTDHHCKYELFKSALAGAVFAYNKDDMALLVKAIRAGFPTKLEALSDAQVIQYHASKYDLKHFVRRITVGSQETFVRVQNAIEVLKGKAGLDENSIHLFKDEAAIDQVWAAQQKHLECIQDPPGMNMYTLTKHVQRNGVSLPYYTTLRGSNSLEGFHAFLPSMIPGPRCAAVPFQVYLLSGIARWNADREYAAVKGQKGRKYRVYTSPLISRLNDRCQKLFGEVEEINFRPPVPIGDEMIGLEFLFSQSDESFDTTDHYRQTLETLQTRDDGEADDEVTHDMDEGNDVEEQDDGYTSDVEVTPFSNLQLTSAAVTPECDPCAEDVCGPCHLPGYQYVENLSSILVNIALQEGRLALTSTEREAVISAWNKLDLHDRSIQQFDSLYSSRWGYCNFGRTKGDPDESGIVQKVKLAERYAPAHLVDARKNRLVYCIIKQLWLHPSSVEKAASPQKKHIAKVYQRLQQRVTVDDPELSKLGIPLTKINTKCVAEFIKRQEARASKNVVDFAGSLVRRTASISHESLQPAAELPDVRPLTSRPETVYTTVPSLAGTRAMKVRRDHFATPTAGTSTEPSGSVPAGIPPMVSPSQRSVNPLQDKVTHSYTMAKSTMYKKRKVDGEGLSCSKKPFTGKTCKLCGETTQGHHKYKKKTYCPQTRMSTSKDLTDRTFSSFDEFKSIVDKQIPWKH